MGAFSVTNRVFAVGSKPTPTSAAKRKRPPKGTSFGFSLDRAARVSLVIERALAGRRGAKKKCVKPSAKLRKAKRCTRYQRVGTLTRSGKAGKNSVAFSGRIGSKALKPGGYRAVITATAPGAPKSLARTVTFKIVKG